MFKVIKPGFYTTVQDAGRFGYRAYGVPVSGVMDMYSSKFANAVLGNSKEAAVLEITMTGPRLQFLEPTIIAISGADMQPKLNDLSIKMNVSIKVEVNDILDFGRLSSGIRTYLAFKDGISTPVVLGSRSFYSPITSYNRIKTNDVYALKSFKGILNNQNAKLKYNQKQFNDETLYAYKGPEFDKLTTELQHQLLNSEFRVSKLNNRMAYQLEPLLKNDLEQILTAPVLPGTVQLTPSGQLIVLMRDCQTTGGYPRVLQFTEKAINILSQKTTIDSIKIRLKE
jgi:biotin-dependent carboxylase-like uncharacterized protein